MPSGERANIYSFICHFLEVPTLEKDQILEEALARTELETLDEIDTVLVLQSGDGEEDARWWCASGRPRAAISE